MFFSPELLSKRDSGFGLLWLAATLGSKSAFKKLPKRSVMTADISQLCRLIATPAEPLALRLSSNLLVGAARVYKVKQEIFMSDVTACFNSLKRVEHEFRFMTSSEGQLQMAQPSVKSSTVTLQANPRTAFSVEFNAMVTDWDEYLNPRTDAEEGSDDEYHPAIKARGKTTVSPALPANAELFRATACTLPDNHDFLFTNSFEASFGGSGTTKVSSSQIGNFAFDDTFDGLDIEEGVGDDLVRELGEGWGANLAEEIEKNLSQVPESPGMNFDTGDFNDVMVDGLADEPRIYTPAISGQDSMASVKCPSSPSLVGITGPRPADGQANAQGCSSCTKLPAQHIYPGSTQAEENLVTLKRTKRARPLILDIRTELTDEELKATRVYYVDMQNTIRCELEVKRLEKRQSEIIHALLWDVPGSLHAKELVDFWAEHFRAHVEARASFVADLAQFLDGSPRQKRRKLSVSPLEPHVGDKKDSFTLIAENWGTDREVRIAPMDNGDMIDINYHTDANWGDIQDHTPNAKNLRSSEEPGQARHAPHLPSVAGDSLGIDVVSDNLHSQRSALFPWDMVGSSSSISAHKGTQYDRISIEHADDKLRGSSVSCRGSSLPSLPANPRTGSPAVILPVIQSDDDFVFDVPGHNHALESRQSEANRVALEKNSYNFLEYVKMQYRSLPNARYLVFDDVVPKATSTARVAAAALYHCLVLATRDLLRIKQEQPYGQIDIRIA